MVHLREARTKTDLLSGRTLRRSYVPRNRTRKTVIVSIENITSATMLEFSKLLLVVFLNFARNTENVKADDLRSLFEGRVFGSLRVPTEQLDAISTNFGRKRATMLRGCSSD